MPKINVYLPDSLAAAVKDASVPVSAVCQAALSEAVERISRTRQGIAALRDPATPDATLTRLASGLLSRSTARLRAATDLAQASVDRQRQRAVSSLDLLRALLVDEENLAVRLLTSHVDLDALREQVAAAAPTEQAAFVGESGFGQMTLAAREAWARALEAVIDAGHNYIGCEHLLIGLAGVKSDAADLFAGLGLRAEALFEELKGASAGMLHERSRAAEQQGPSISELTRRIETLERRLDQSVGR